MQLHIASVFLSLIFINNLKFMNQVIAEIRLYNIFTPTINISKSFETHNYSKHYRNVGFERLLKQGFIWYQDFISFHMLSDYREYWVKIAVKKRLKIDSVIANTNKDNSVIILPFQVLKTDRIYVFADYGKGVIFSFTLPLGHYQLLFQNRFFTREEIEAEPNFNCEDLDYDDWDEEIELCLLTFIPIETAIQPKILAYKSSLGSKNLPTSLILYDRKMYQNGE